MIGNPVLDGLLQDDAQAARALPQLSNQPQPLCLDGWVIHLVPVEVPAFIVLYQVLYHFSELSIQVGVRQSGLILDLVVRVLDGELVGQPLCHLLA